MSVTRTVLNVCSAAGTALDPFIIFTEKNMQGLWFGDEALLNTFYGKSENGLVYVFYIQLPFYVIIEFHFFIIFSYMHQARTIVTTTRTIVKKWDPHVAQHRLAIIGRSCDSLCLRMNNSQSNALKKGFSSE